MSSSQLTKSYFSEGRLNHQPDNSGDLISGSLVVATILLGIEASILDFHAVIILIHRLFLWAIAAIAAIAMWNNQRVIAIFMVESNCSILNQLARRLPGL